MSHPLSRQAERLHRVFADLVRRYQFRDREGICCHGLSVSQCYTLETLAKGESATMGELARRLHLEVSSMTRIVDRLVSGKLVTRCVNPSDRRVCCVKITRQGRTLVDRIRGELVKEHELVLREVPPESREAVIAAMGHLLSAFRQRLQQQDA